MKISLTGGIACGKSAFAKFLVELGIRVLDADDVVHELESPGGAAVGPIAAKFGDSLVASDGGIDRAQLAQIVFADPERRRELENILFPLVRERLENFAVDDGSLKISIVPLLFESHFDEIFDIILCITSPHNLQVERMMLKRGYSREQAEARIAAQMPVDEKAGRAHYVVVNDSTPEQLKREAIRLVSWLKERQDYGRQPEHPGGVVA